MLAMRLMAWGSDFSSFVFRLAKKMQADWSFWRQTCRLARGRRLRISECRLRIQIGRLPLRLATAKLYLLSMRNPMRPAVATFAFMFLAAAAAVSADWTQFRGPRGDGRADESVTGLPIAWSDTQNLAWQTEIPGRGWSSPIVLGDRIWLTTAEPLALPTKERDKRLADLPYVPRDLTAHAAVTVYAVELDAASGLRLRQIDLFTVENPPVIHNNNSYASPTPIAD